MDLKLTADDIKFCRRVGERSSEARPLVIGLYNSRNRANLLKADTSGTEGSEVSIGPDLTKLQRKEEADTRKEMEELNRNLSAEER